MPGAAGRGPARPAWGSVAAVFMAVLAAGCSAAPGLGTASISHAHGIGFDPGMPALYVATHHGLVKGTPTEAGWSWDTVGTERYDLMGFSQDAVDPGVLYTSGHPDDPRTVGAVHLGLRRSTDGGVSWEDRSLKGTVDFHSLAALPGVSGGLVGLWGNKLKETRDGGLTWTDHEGPGSRMADVAVTREHVWVATDTGLHRGGRSYAGWVPVAGPDAKLAPNAVDAAPDGSVLWVGTGNGREGGTWRQEQGQAWQKASEGGLAALTVPAHFAFDPTDARHVFAVTVGGRVTESRDAGATWTVLRAGSSFT